MLGVRVGGIFSLSMHRVSCLPPLGVPVETLG